MQVTMAAQAESPMHASVTEQQLVLTQLAQAALLNVTPHAVVPVVPPLLLPLLVPPEPLPLELVLHWLVQLFWRQLSSALAAEVHEAELCWFLHAGVMEAAALNVPPEHTQLR